MFGKGLQLKTTTLMYFFVVSKSLKSLFLLYIDDLPDDLIFNITIYVDNTNVYSKFGQASYLWQ